MRIPRRELLGMAGGLVLGGLGMWMAQRFLWSGPERPIPREAPPFCPAEATDNLSPEEALARLESMGLVDIQRGRGTFVGSRTSLANCVRLLRSAVTISPQELRTYAELRSALEVQAVRQAAECATDADISELAALLKRLDDDELPYPEALELDFQFHRKLIDIAGNPLMRNLIEVIYEFVLTQMARTTPSPRDNQLGRRLHKAIFKAIREHNGDAAATAMQQHMQAILDRLSKEPS